LVEKFVALTARDYCPLAAPIGAPLAEAPIEPAAAPPQAPEVKLPPWLSEDESFAPLQASPTRAVITTIPQAEEFVVAELERRRPRVEIIQELAQLSGEPVELAARFLAVVENRRAAHRRPLPAAVKQNTAQRHRLTIEQNPELVQFIVSELGKHRKRSDVVAAVCERTGREWKEVQSFVAEVEVQERGKVQARKNVVLIPLGILIIIGGLALMLPGIVETVLLAMRLLAIPLPQSSGGEAGNIGGLFVGALMVGGGAYSIYRGVRAQID